METYQVILESFRSLDKKFLIWYKADDHVILVNLNQF